jgi:hypothetical protein
MFKIFLRSFGFGIGCAVALIGMIWIANAASGGFFGDILAKILGITPAQVTTYTGDGTVANSAKLGGVPAAQFQKIVPGQSCGAGKCIYGYDTSGNILCR